MKAKFSDSDAQALVTGVLCLLGFCSPDAKWILFFAGVVFVLGSLVHIVSDLLTSVRLRQLIVYRLSGLNLALVLSAYLLIGLRLVSSGFADIPLWLNALLALTFVYFVLSFFLYDAPFHSK